MKLFYVSKKIFPRCPWCPGHRLLLQLLMMASSPTSWFQLRPRPPARASSTHPGPRLALLYLTSPMSTTDLTPSRPQDLPYRISPRPCHSGSTGDNLPLPRP